MISGKTGEEKPEMRGEKGGGSGEYVCRRTDEERSERENTIFFI